MPPPEIQPKKKKRAGDDERAETGAAAAPGPASADAAIPGMDAAKAAKKGKETDISKLIDSIDDGEKEKTRASADAIVEFKGEAGTIVPKTKKMYNYSAQIIPRLASKWPKPPGTHRGSSTASSLATWVGFEASRWIPPTSGSRPDPRIARLRSGTSPPGSSS